MSAGFIRQQLEVEKRLLGYRFSPDADRDSRATDLLAQNIAGLNIADIRDLSLHRGTDTTTVMVTQFFEGGDAGYSADVPVTHTFPVVYLYNNKTNAKIPGGFDFYCDPNAMVQSGQDTVQNQCPQIPSEGAPFPFLHTSLPDRWNNDFSVIFRADGIPVFIPNEWRGDSAWQTTRNYLTFLFTAASFVIPGIGATIGAYIFTAEFAAAYPAVVTIATNTAFNAALGGMDIEHAVGAALGNFVGGGFGNIVGGQVDSAIIGKLTGAAATAAINGGDVQNAVAMAALNYGASTPSPQAPSLNPVGVNMDDESAVTEFVNTTNLFPDNTYSFTIDAPAFGAELANPAVLPSAESPFMTADTADITGQSGMTSDAAFTPQGGPSPSSVPAAILSPSTPSDSISWNDIVKNVSSAAIAALQVVKAYQSTGMPSPRAPLPSQTVNRDGTITTTAPTGSRTVAKLPAGMPYVLGDGTLVMNNGDGSYSLTTPAGATTKYVYPLSGLTTVPGASMIAGVDSTKLLMYGGVAVLALYLLSRRKG
jgi:hypothetical protein